MMKYKSDKEKIVIDKMINKKLIPSKGNFLVDDELVNKYVKIYDAEFSSNDGLGKHKTNNRLARKLAGLTLLRLNDSRNELKLIFKAKQTTKNNFGFVYIVSNPAFDGCVKIGLTKNLNKRLDTYQTYDPFRQFKVEHYTVCENVRELEKRILDKFSIDLIKGEWLKIENTKPILEELFR